MTQYSGVVQYYSLVIFTPNYATAYKSVINLEGPDFGTARLWFVPEGGQLGQNKKYPNLNQFDIYYRMSSWPHFTELLRNHKPVRFLYDDSDNTAQIRSLDEPPGG